MSTLDQKTNFDSLFLLAEADDTLGAKQQVHTMMKEMVANKMANMHQAGPKQVLPSSGSRGGSGHGSRGSPARIPTKTTLCPSNPAAPSRSHSCRDQTGHMREKYQVGKICILNT